MFNNTITLSNGVVVPQLALGTWLDGKRFGAGASEDEIRSWIDGLQ